MLSNPAYLPYQRVDFSYTAGRSEFNYVKLDGVELVKEPDPDLLMSTTTVPALRASTVDGIVFSDTMKRNGSCTFYDDIFIEVIKPQLFEASDTNKDGITDMEDLVEMAAKWLL